MTVSDWEKVNACLLTCGACGSVEEFAETVLREMRKLCKFDSAVALIHDGEGRLVSQKFYQYKKPWIQAYINYYGKLSIQRSHMPKEVTGSGVSFVGFTDWIRFPQGEYLNDYIRQRGLTASGYISLRNREGKNTIVFAFDRTDHCLFSETEQEIFHTVLPHLDLMQHQYYARNREGGPTARQQALLDIAELTPQEQKITRLLCRGVSQGDISNALCISVATTRKHIANIYRKTGVRNLQELMVRFLNP